MTAAQPAWVALGGNLGDPVGQFVRALAGLGATPGVTLGERSSLYRTRPWGEQDQPDFLNAVVALDTTLAPRALLGILKELERDAGRTRDRRWGPRTLDLDLLLYADRRSADPGLQLPHPRMHSRAFVLVPLAELAPGLEVPGRGRVEALLGALDPDERAGIRRVPDERWETP